MPFVLSAALLLQTVGLFFHAILPNELILYSVGIDNDKPNNRDLPNAQFIKSLIRICPENNSTEHVVGSLNRVFVFDVPAEEEQLVDCASLLTLRVCLDHLVVNGASAEGFVELHRGFTFPADPGKIEQNDASGAKSSCLKNIQQLSARSALPSWWSESRQRPLSDHGWTIAFDKSSALVPIIYYGSNDVSFLSPNNSLDVQIGHKVRMLAGQTLLFDFSIIKNGIARTSTNLKAHQPNVTSDFVVDTVTSSLPCLSIVQSILNPATVPIFLSSGAYSEHHMSEHQVSQCGLEAFVHRVNTRTISPDQWKYLTLHESNFIDSSDRERVGSYCTVLGVQYATQCQTSLRRHYDGRNSSLHQSVGHSVFPLCLESVLENIRNCHQSSQALTSAELGDRDTHLHYLTAHSIPTADSGRIAAIDLQQITAAFSDTRISRLYVKSIEVSDIGSLTESHAGLFNDTISLLLSVMKAEENQVDEQYNAFGFSQQLTHLLSVAEAPISSAYFIGYCLIKLILRPHHHYSDREVLVLQRAMSAFMEATALVSASDHSLLASIRKAGSMAISENPYRNYTSSKDNFDGMMAQLDAANTANHKSHVLIFIQEHDLNKTREFIQQWKEQCLDKACHFYVKPIIITLPTLEYDQHEPFSGASDVCSHPFSTSERLPSIKWALKRSKHHIKHYLRADEIVVILIGAKALLSFIPPGSSREKGIIPSGLFEGAEFYKLPAPIIVSSTDNSLAIEVRHTTIAGVAGAIHHVISAVLNNPLFSYSDSDQVFSLMDAYIVSIDPKFVHIDRAHRYFEEPFLPSCDDHVAGRSSRDLDVVTFNHSVSGVYKSYRRDPSWQPMIVAKDPRTPDYFTLDVPRFEERVFYTHQQLSNHCHVLEVIQEVISMFKQMYLFNTRFEQDDQYKWSWVYTVAKFNSISIFYHLCPALHVTLSEGLDALELTRLFTSDLLNRYGSHAFQIDYQMPHMALASIHFDIGSLNQAVTEFYSSYPILYYSEFLATKDRWVSFQQRSIAAVASRAQSDERSIAAIKTHYLTYATSHKPELDYLIRSGNLSGIDITVLGLGTRFDSYSQKWTVGYIPHIEQLPDDDIVVLMDAYDTIVFPALKNISNVLLASTAPIMFCAEYEPYPDFVAPYVYPTVQFFGSGAEVDSEPYHYRPQFLNSGCIVGIVHNIKQMWKLVKPYMLVQKDDQQALARFYYTYPHMASIDVDNNAMVTGYRRDCHDEHCSIISLSSDLTFSWGNDIRGVGLVHFNQKGKSPAYNRTASLVVERFFEWLKF